MEGKEEGLKEGKEEGEKLKALDIATRLKLKGVLLEDIVDITGLSKVEIEKG